MLHLALIQMHCEKGAVRQNLAAIAGYLAEAAARAVDVLALPEMCLTGYADPNRYPHAVLRLDGPEVAELLRLTQPYDVTLLGGLIEHNGAGKPFITHIVARRGELLGSYRKITIKDGEADWFSPGADVLVFPVREHTCGLAICADIDNPVLFAELRRQGAEIVFEVAAPGLYGEQEGRNWASGYRWWEGKCQEQLGTYARANGLWIAVATQAGRTVDEDFPGGGYVFAPDGERVAATADWSPSALYVTLSPSHPLTLSPSHKRQPPLILPYPAPVHRLARRHDQRRPIRKSDNLVLFVVIGDRAAMCADRHPLPGETPAINTIRQFAPAFSSRPSSRPSSSQSRASWKPQPRGNPHSTPPMVYCCLEIRPCFASAVGCDWPPPAALAAWLPCQSVKGDLHHVCRCCL